MTTIHAQLIGDRAILPRQELETLIELARLNAMVELQAQEEKDDWSTWNLMRLAEQGGSFDFWKEEGEDIYTIEDGEPV